MGLAKGIFMIDSQTIAQSPINHGPEIIDNSEMLLYHMDRYGVDMGILKVSIGYSNEFNAKLVEKHPNRFIALCNDSQTQGKALKGEKAWNIKDAAKEIESYLSTGLYKGIGEGMARDRTEKMKLISWDERLDQICHVMELARKYKVPVNYHVGLPVGGFSHRNLARSRAHDDACDNGNPLLCHEIAAMYPDVPIVMSHGGIEASAYFMQDYDRCLNVAGSHKNVFLETGQWWAELYEKPLLDVNIGAKKLVWGCAWGAPLNQQWMPGQIPTTYTCNNIYEDRSKQRPYQTNIYGWSLREIGRLNIPQQDLDLILGGNAAWIYKIDTPVLSGKQLFKDVNRGFDNSK